MHWLSLSGVRDVRKCPLVPVIENRGFTSDALDSTKQASQDRCETRCRKMDRFWCHSFVYSPDTKDCLLYNIDKESRDLVEKPGFNYHELNCGKGKNPSDKPLIHCAWLLC